MTAPTECRQQQQQQQLAPAWAGASDRDLPRSGGWATTEIGGEVGRSMGFSAGRAARHNSRWEWYSTTGRPRKDREDP